MVREGREARRPGHERPDHERPEHRRLEHRRSMQGQTNDEGRSLHTQELFEEIIPLKTSDPVLILSYFFPTYFSTLIQCVEYSCL